MIKFIAIAVLGTGLFTGFTGSAPRAIDLVPGQIYRTGSPLSQPGVIGLFGGLAGTHTGGGFERWNGPTVAATDEVLHVTGTWSQAGPADYSVQQATTYTIEQATAAQDKINWSTVENRPRTVVPDCDGHLYVTYVVDNEIGARAEYECEEIN